MTIKADHAKTFFWEDKSAMKSWGFFKKECSDVSKYRRLKATRFEDKWMRDDIGCAGCPPELPGQKPLLIPAHLPRETQVEELGLWL